MVKSATWNFGWVAIALLAVILHPLMADFTITRSAGTSTMGQIFITLTNDSRAWDLHYLDGSGTNWVRYLTKWTSNDPLGELVLDLHTNSSRQLWRLQGR